MVARPELRLKPLAITQKYLVVTCNYPARSHGVKKLMSIKEAKRVCPQLVLVSGERLDQFRRASKEIFDCIKDQMGRERDDCQAFTLQTVSDVIVERVGFDEVFLDLTELCHCYAKSSLSAFDASDLKTFKIGKPSSDEGEKLFIIAAKIASRTRARLFSELGYECCAGISVSKMASKIAVNAHKPNAQTIIYHSAILPLIVNLPLRRLVGIGWKTAQALQGASIITVADALATPFRDLESIISAGIKNGGESRARYVFLASRGIDESNLVDKGKEKVISVEDSMRQCNTSQSVEMYLRQLAVDLVIRLDEDSQCHNRQAQRFTLRLRDNFNGSSSKYSKKNSMSKWNTISASMPIEIADMARTLDSRAKVLSDAMITVFHRHKNEPFNMTGIGVAASHFTNFVGKKQRSLKQMLVKGAPAESEPVGLSTVSPNPVVLEGCFVCNECNAQFPTEQSLVEHKDFHFATRLAASSAPPLKFASGSASHYSPKLSPAERLAKRTKTNSSRTGLKKYFARR